MPERCFAAFVTIWWAVKQTGSLLRRTFRNCAAGANGFAKKIRSESTEANINPVSFVHAGYGVRS